MVLGGVSCAGGGGRGARLPGVALEPEVTPGAAAVPQSPAAQLSQPGAHAAQLRPGVAGDGVSSVEYLAGEDSQARVTARTALAEGGELLLQCEINGSITDLFVRLPAPGGASVVLAPELRDRFIVLAVQDGGLLEIGVSALRKADARTAESCVDDAGLATVLRDRWTLSGSVAVCLISHEPRTASDDTHAIVYRRASTAGTIQPVSGVQVRLVDGQYEVGWPAFLKGDYDQNGEVGLSDLAPLAMLFGLKPGGPGSLTLPDAVKRVDGDGNGEINLADIARIAQNFKNTNHSFRVERSAGDAGGPGLDWESAGVASRSAVTKTGEALTAVSRAAYQRFRDAIAPGWTYYRVVALSDNAPEATPSEAVLAPDGTPPAFSGDVGLTGGYDPVNGYQFEFNQNAADDRGGPLAWAMQLSGGGDPDKVPIMWEFTDGTSLHPVASPFVMLLADGSELWLVQDEQYYVRLRIADEGGSSAYSGWYGFPAVYGPAASSEFSVDENSLVLWVNRQGTVRFTPPPSNTYQGLSPQIRIYAKSVPWYTDRNDYLEVADYAGVTPIEYTSGEVVLSDMLHNGEELLILIYYEGRDGGQSSINGQVQYPYYWFAPLSDSADTGGGTITGCDPIHYLSDGTPFQQISAGANYLALYRGGSLRMSPLDGVSSDAVSNVMSSTFPVLQVTPGTGEIIFYGTPHGKGDEKGVYWWSPQGGLTGQVQIPTGVFSANIGLQDTLYEWQPLDKDTLLAARSHVQTLGDGTKVVEIWQAERGQGVSLRTTYPVRADAPHMEDGSVLYLDQIGDNGEIVIHEVWQAGLMSPYYSYYHVIDMEGDWSICDMNVMPSSTGPWTSWPKVYNEPYECRVSKGITAYGIVRAKTNPDAPSSEYTGLYTGAVVSGLQNWTQLVAFCSVPGTPDVIASAQPVTLLEFIPPYDGTAVWGEGTPGVGTWYYLTDSQGRVVVKCGAEYNPYGPGCNFYKLYTYYTRQGLMPGLANALLSEDGEWLAVGKEGAYGLAYWNTGP